MSNSLQLVINLSHLTLLIIQQSLPLSATRVGLSILFSISKASYDLQICFTVAYRIS